MTEPTDPDTPAGPDPSGGQPPEGTPGYGSHPLFWYGPPPGPGHGPSPGYGPAYGPPGYGPPPGYHPGYGPPGYGPPPGYHPAYGPPGYGPPAGYDPLVSPDYAGWWQRGLAILRRGWKPLLLLQLLGVVATLVVQIPTSVFSILTIPVLEDPAAVSDEVAIASVLGASGGVLGLTLLDTAVGVIVLSLVTLASIHVALAVVTGGHAGLRDALRGATRRVLPLIGWQLLAGLIILVGLCACILPGIYLAGVFTILPAVVAFERGAVIERCFRLFHGSFGPSLARVATIAGLAIAGAMLAGVPGVAISAFTTGDPTATGTMIAGAVAGTTLAAVVSGAVALLTAPLTLTAYADMRARVEPLSTAVLAQELATGAR